MTELEHIDQEIKTIEAALEPLEKRLRDLRFARRTILSPLKVGQTIVWGQSGEKKGVVEEILERFGDHYDYRVTRILKNGTKGCNVRVYSFDCPKPASNL